MRTLLPGLAVTALTVALLPAPAHAEGAVPREGSPTAVPGSYVVKLKDPAAADALMAALDGRVRHAVDNDSVTQDVNGHGTLVDALVADTSPTRVVEAITSGAHTRTDARSPFSNYGTGVDLYAAGVGIGTSMATGFVSGVAVRFLQSNPTATPAQVQTELTKPGPVPWGGRLLHFPPTR